MTHSTPTRSCTSPLIDPEPDPAVEAMRRRIDPLKRRLGEADHYGIDADKVSGGGADRRRQR